MRCLLIFIITILAATLLLANLVSVILTTLHSVYSKLKEVYLSIGADSYFIILLLISHIYA